jgi:hypothetical protein
VSSSASSEFLPKTHQSPQVPLQSHTLQPPPIPHPYSKRPSQAIPPSFPRYSNPSHPSPSGGLYPYSRSPPKPTHPHEPMILTLIRIPHSKSPMLSAHVNTNAKSRSPHLSHRERITPPMNRLSRRLCLQFGVGRAWRFIRYIFPVICVNCFFLQRSRACLGSLMYVEPIHAWGRHMHTYTEHCS